MRAIDVMATPVLSVGPETSVRELAGLLCEKGISGVPVVDAEGRVVGMVSEGDLLHRAETGTRRQHSWWLETFASNRELAREYIKSHGQKVADIMTTPVVAVSEETPLNEVADILERHRIKRVPVLRDGRAVGIVSRANLVRALALSKPEPGKGWAIDDLTIRERLLAEIAHEKWAQGSLASILVQDHIVHLWPEYLSEEERHALHVAALRIPGVEGVHDHSLETPILPPL
jgi:CBS domain-containing protein